MRYNERMAKNGATPITPEQRAAFMSYAKNNDGCFKHSACGLFHRRGRCPRDPAIMAERSGRFADIKANGNAFKGVKVER